MHTSSRMIWSACEEWIEQAIWMDTWISLNWTLTANAMISGISWRTHRQARRRPSSSLYIVLEYHTTSLVSVGRQSGRDEYKSHPKIQISEHLTRKQRSSILETARKSNSQDLRARWGGDSRNRWASINNIFRTRQSEYCALRSFVVRLYLDAQNRTGHAIRRIPAHP